MATFQLMDNVQQEARIKVVGVGGGGNNAVNYMALCGIEGAEFININTDAQVLRNMDTMRTLQIGTNVTRGLGAGSNPQVGREAAEEDRQLIEEALQGADMVFLATGLGGGTGTGATPVVAEVAREMGILTVAVVTKPFMHEGNDRKVIAEEGAKELVEHVDSLITIPNDKLIEVLGPKATLKEALAEADDVLRNGVQGIAELITRQGLINVDFADVRTVMSCRGTAMMGIGMGSGEDRAREAAEAAIHSPLLDDLDLSGAKGVLVNITAKEDSLGLGEYHEIGRIVGEIAAGNAKIKIGTAYDDSLGDQLRVTVVATGIGVREEEPARDLRVVQPPRADGRNDYDTLDRPTWERRNKTEQRKAVVGLDSDMDVFDIPAFLRRQNN